MVLGVDILHYRKKDPIILYIQYNTADAMAIFRFQQHMGSPLKSHDISQWRIGHILSISLDY